MWDMQRAAHLRSRLYPGAVCLPRARWLLSLAQGELIYGQIIQITVTSISLLSASKNVR